MATPPRIPLEAPGRLSRSLLWRLQRRFFEQRGPAAWSDGVVPHWITSNPFLAQAYGRMVLGYLRDESIDRSQPVYLVELGAGSGRLAFHVLRYLDRMAASPVLRGLDLRYVLTDFAEANLAAWRDHPALAAWCAAGRLDFARFDAEHDTAIVLERSGVTLAPRASGNPLIVIANYVFDGLPLDGFSVRGGRLHDWQVSLCSDRVEPELDDPAILARAKLAYAEHAIDAPAYYGDPELDDLLEDHRAALAETAFTFPSASLACVRRLAALAPRLLVLTTDKGEVHEAALRGQAGPDITVHGSFSIAVNYHAIAELVRRGGGEPLVPEARALSVTTCAFVVGAPAGPETRQAYAEAIGAQAPDDLFAVRQAIAPANLPLAQLIGYLRFTGHDPRIIADCLPALLAHANAATADERGELLRVIRRAWAGYFHIGEPDDLGFALGALAAALEAWPDAIALFEGSLRWYGDDIGTLFNLATCHHQLGQREATEQRLAQILAIDPACAPAIALRARLADG